MDIQNFKMDIFIALFPVEKTMRMRIKFIFCLSSNFHKLEARKTQTFFSGLHLRAYCHFKQKI